MKFGIFVSAVAGASLAAGAASAVTVVNGGFEESVLADGTGFTTYGTGSGSLTGWTIDNGSIDHIRDYWENAEGDQSIDLAGNTDGSISQTVTGFVVGDQYELSFAIAGNPDNNNADVYKISLIAAGEEVGVFLFDTTGHTRDDMGWEYKTLRFRATTEDVTIAFSSQGDGAFGTALDDVSINEIPLPATGLMLLGGLGGFAALRRRKETK